MLAVREPINMPRERILAVPYAINLPRELLVAGLEAIDLPFARQSACQQVFVACHVETEDANRRLLAYRERVARPEVRLRRGIEGKP
jgi:hypothetical protein